MDPASFFEAVRAYDKSADNFDSKGFTRCGTVASNYGGSGPAQVVFDGEESISQKSYHFINTPPNPGTRVVLLPIGPTYVILGMVNGGV